MSLLDVRDHVMPSLMVLHWLLIHCSIDFKLCTIMYVIHTDRCPAYLKDIIRMSSSTATRTGLRSASSSKYVTPRLQTKFGERALSHAGPAAWNCHLTFVLQPAPPCSRNYSECTYLTQHIPPASF